MGGGRGCGVGLGGTSRRKICFVWPTVFFESWTKVPTKLTQKSGFLTRLLKNGKTWQYEMIFLPSNDQQAVSSNIRVSHTSPVPSSIISSSRPGSLHPVSPAGPGGHLHVCICSGSLSPLRSGRHHGGGGIRAGP